MDGVNQEWNSTFDYTSYDYAHACSTDALCAFKIVTENWSAVGIEIRYIFINEVSRKQDIRTIPYPNIGRSFYEEFPLDLHDKLRLETEILACSSLPSVLIVLCVEYCTKAFQAEPDEDLTLRQLNKHDRLTDLDLYLSLQSKCLTFSMRL